MKMRNISKNALAVAVGAGLVAAPVLSAQAYEFGISGQINRVVIQADDGNDDAIFFSDSDTSSSRLRAKGSGDFGNGQAGFTWEHQFESNSGASITLPGVAAGTRPDGLRKAEVWMSGDYGKITFGQGSDAIDGVTEYDLAGNTFWATSVAAYTVDHMASITFVDTNTGAPTGVTVGSVITSFDGGRRDRIRYDSPTLGGALSFAVSLADGERLDAHVAGNHEFGQSAFTWAVGLRDDGDAGGTVVDAGGAIVPDNIEPSTTLGSASLLIGGFSFTVSFAERDFDVAGRDDGEQTYFRLAYTPDGSAHTIGVGAGTYDDIGANGDEAEVFQFGWSYAANSSVVLYASFTEAELDDIPGTTFDDVTTLAFGTRVTFK